MHIIQQKRTETWLKGIVAIIRIEPSKLMDTYLPAIQPNVRNVRSIVSKAQMLDQARNFEILFSRR